jgi:alkylated DNA repair dioxygenase AlkB
MQSSTSSASQETFPGLSALPEGFRYKPELIEIDVERSLIESMHALDFAPFQFHGFEGKRRVVSYGWRYDFNGGGLKKAEGLPAFLLPVREAAAAAFGIDSASLEQALLLEYPPGAMIGWHRDRPVFGDVIGICLLSACTFRFRRKAGAKWERHSLMAKPRSAYILQGPARSEWEHSIPAVPELRYSITLRSIRDRRFKG